jgi:two-component system, cell cycle sensor histidine kinase and response regulator CckA
MTGRRGRPPSERCPEGGSEKTELSAIFQALSDLYFRVGRDGTILDHRAGRADGLYLPPERFLGKRMSEVLPEPVGKRLQEAIERTIGERVKVTVEYPLPLPAGEKMFEAVFVPFEDEQAIVVARDVTQRSEAERDLREALDWQETIFEGSRDAIFISDVDSHFTAVNRAACELTGYTRDELLTMRIPDLHESIDLHAYEAFHDRILAGEETVTVAKILRKDGRKVDTEFNNRRITVGGVTYMHTSARDVSERQRAQEDLEFLKRSVELSADAVFWHNPDGRFAYVNEAACRSLGYTRDELLRMHLSDVNERATPAKLAEAWSLTKRGETLHVETVHRRKDGSTFPVEVQSIYIKLGDREHVCGFARDVTERKRAEDALRESHKMQAIGQLAGGVAHDFNNLLQALLGTVDVLRLRSSDAHAVADGLAELEANVKRGAALTRQLLLFARREVVQLEELRLDNVVRDTVDLLRRLLRENIHLEYESSSQALLVEGDRGQLEQVIVNLAMNAADAMPEGGWLVIRSGRTSDAEAFLEVADSGTGIPEAIRGRIFEPFFTTKGAEKGIGLGLAVVHGIVTQHGGRIEMTSRAGEGSSFRVVLPCLGSGRRGAAGEQTRPADLLAPGDGERLLLVEDEDEARRVLAQLLTTLGYDVTSVGSGEEALQLLPFAPFDVLLTDLLLPGIHGGQVAEALQQRWPALKVVVMSGYTEDEAVRRWASRDGVRFLQKPFGMDVLAHEVRAALDEE